MSCLGSHLFLDWLSEDLLKPNGTKPKLIISSIQVLRGGGIYIYIWLRTKHNYVNRNNQTYQSFLKKYIIKLFYINYYEVIIFYLFNITYTFKITYKMIIFIKIMISL